MFASVILLGSIVISVSAQDTIRPEIYSWGIDGNIGESPTFTVWANVTDNASGIQNVTANIRQDGGEREVSLMTFNSTFYAVTLPHVELNHTYLVWVESYDNEGNLAVSFSRNFDLMIYTDITIDSSVTFPYVISASLITLVMAIGLSYEYNKRNPREETPDSQEEIVESDAPKND
jgi:hypothetical protein